MRTPWGPEEEFRFTIVMGLRKGLKRVYGIRRALTEQEQYAIAESIAEHIRLAKWDVRRGIPNE